MTNRACAQVSRPTHDALAVEARAHDAQIARGVLLFHQALEDARKSAPAYVRLWNIPGGGE